MGAYKDGSDTDLSIFARIEKEDFISHINKVGILFYSKFFGPKA